MVSLNCQVIIRGLAISKSFGSTGPYEQASGPFPLNDYCGYEVFCLPDCS
jgi:hypothetical protein